MLATTSRLMHVLWNSTGDLVSANKDEGAAEDDYLEFDKGKENILDSFAKVQRTYVTFATSVVSTNVEA